MHLHFFQAEDVIMTLDRYIIAQNITGQQHSFTG